MEDQKIYLEISDLELIFAKADLFASVSGI
jgi:hypothetical protein